MNSAERLEACFCPFGRLDLQAVCDIADSV